MGPNINSLAIGKLNGGETIKILKRAANKSADGYYWDLIVSNQLGTYGYAARYVDGDECIVSLGTTGSSSGTVNNSTETPGETTEKPTEQPTTSTTPTTPNTPVENIANKVEISGNYFKTIPSINMDTITSKYTGAVVKNLKGEKVTTGKVGTGFTVTIQGKTYTIVKKGDINGDGNANISDAISILNHLKEKNKISGIKLEAAKVMGQSKVTIADAIRLLNSLKEKGEIEL